MYTLDELRKLIELDTVHTIIRTPYDQVVYELHKKQIADKWVSMTDKMLCTVFGVQCCVDGVGKMYVDYATIPKDVKLELLQNDFPYPICDNMRHYVLWKLNGQVTSDDIHNAMADLQKTVTITDYVYWENATYKKSVPGIEHIHIIVQLE